MSYKLIIKPSALNEINSLPALFQDRIINAIDDLPTNPRPSGCKKLFGSKNRWRLRIGDYRILYKLGDSLKEVYVYRVAHRKDVYR